VILPFHTTHSGEAAAGVKEGWLAVLRNRATGESLEIVVDQGGAVHQLSLRHPSLDGRVLALLANGPEVRFAGSQLVPWANRVRDGTYQLPDGRRFVGLAINEPFPRHTSLHGLLYDRAMNIVSSSATEERASITLGYQFNGSDEGYPFKVAVQLTYSLISTSSGPTRMECETTAHNEGGDAAPFGVGWHPYFCLPSRNIDNFKLTVKSGKSLIVDEQMIPVGSEEWTGMQDEPLGGKALDSGFQIEEPCGEDGLHRTLLRDPESHVTLVLWQDRSFPFLQIYTPPTRDSIAIEPMSHPTNGFNSGHFTLLEPHSKSSRFHGRYGVHLE